MKLSEVVEALNEMRPEGDEASNTTRILMAKLGQMAEGGVRMDAVGDDSMTDEEEAEARREMLAGLVVASAEYAIEHGIDIDQAVEERVEEMEKRFEAVKQRQEAVESGDAKALAEALKGATEDGTEGATEDGADDEGGPRYIG